MLNPRQEQFMHVAFSNPIGLGSLSTATSVHITRMVYHSPLGLLCIFTASLLHSNSALATTQADHTRKFAQTLRVCYSLLTATFLHWF